MSRLKRPANPFESEVDFPRSWIRDRAARRIAFFKRRGASADSQNLFADRPALGEERLPSMWTPTPGESDSEGEVDEVVVHKINVQRRREARAAGKAAEVTPPKVFLKRYMPRALLRWFSQRTGSRPLSLEPWGVALLLAGGRGRGSALRSAGPASLWCRGSLLALQDRPVRAGVSTGFVAKKRPAGRSGKLASLGLASLAVGIMAHLGSLGAQDSVSGKDAIVWHGSVGVVHGAGGHWALLQREHAGWGGLEEAAEDVEMGDSRPLGMRVSAYPHINH